MSASVWKELWGECLGTFILVFIGCGSVGLAAINHDLNTLWQVALCWTVGVTLAIQASKHWSPAHLNPAVTLCMCLIRNHSWRRLLPYSLAQLSGAFTASFALYLLFQNSLEQMLMLPPSDVLDGLSGKEWSAQMFGEFFPNPGYRDIISVNWPVALLAEMLNTAVLLYMIVAITQDMDRLRWKHAVLIAITVGLLICIAAPFTQCGMNPARDLGPRLFASLSDWGSSAWASPWYHSLLVYVLGPLVGAFIVAQFLKS